MLQEEDSSQSVEGICSTTLALACMHMCTTYVQRICAILEARCYSFQIANQLMNYYQHLVPGLTAYAVNDT